MGGLFLMIKRENSDFNFIFRKLYTMVLNLSKILKLIN